MKSRETKSKNKIFFKNMQKLDSKMNVYYVII